SSPNAAEMGPWASAGRLDNPLADFAASEAGLAKFATGALPFGFMNDGALSVFVCASVRTHAPPASATAKLKVRTFRKLFSTRFVTVQCIGPPYLTSSGASSFSLLTGGFQMALGNWPNGSTGE